MQNLTSRKDKEFVSEKLNQQIRHLLFLNPLLDIRVIKNHLAMLPNQLKNDKLETIRLLTKQRMDFINSSSNNGYIKRHIRNWEREIGPVTFGDVVQLIEGRGITVMEAAPHLVVPQQIEQWLSKFLIGQPEYARKLSFCFYLHEIRKNDKE